MEFEWDDWKNRSNIHKHGISFDLALSIFEGPVYTWTDDRQAYGEVRQVSIGSIENAAVAVVVHTDRNGVIRIISARRASRKEKRLYEEALRQTDDG